jgi:hypothetical protein
VLFFYSIDISQTYSKNPDTQSPSHERTFRHVYEGHCYYLTEAENKPLEILIYVSGISIVITIVNAIYHNDWRRPGTGFGEKIPIEIKRDKVEEAAGQIR